MQIRACALIGYISNDYGKPVMSTVSLTCKCLIQCTKYLLFASISRSLGDKSDDKSCSFTLEISLG